MLTGIATKKVATRILALALGLFTATQALALHPQNSDQQQRSCTAEGYLRIAIYPAGKQTRPPVSVILADPQGRRLGYDPVHKVEYADVPEASFMGDTGQASTPESRPSQLVLELCNPVGGKYQLRIVGTETGHYTMAINAANREFPDAEGRPMALDSRAELPATASRRGLVQTFVLVYSRTPGVKVRLKPSIQ